MHQLFNTFINLLKWPIAFAAVILLIPVSYRLWKVLAYIYDNANLYSSLLYGLVSYFILWFFWFRYSVMAQWFATLEHELTHAAFAVLSLNRVTDLKASGDAGGVMHYQGYANWIITLSPYFVPLLSLLVLLVLSIAKVTYTPVLLFIMGLSLAYHLQSTWQETHFGQIDLKQSGWLFVWLFLPTANLLMLLVLLTALPYDGLSTARSLDYVVQDLEYEWYLLQGFIVKN